MTSRENICAFGYHDCVSFCAFIGCRFFFAAMMNSSRIDVRMSYFIAPQSKSHRRALVLTCIALPLHVRNWSLFVKVCAITQRASKDFALGSRNWQSQRAMLQLAVTPRLMWQFPAGGVIQIHKEYIESFSAQKNMFANFYGHANHFELFYRF